MSKNFVILLPLNRFFLREKWRLSFLYVFSLFLVAFGHPAWIPKLAPFAASCGIGCFFFVLHQIPSSKHRKQLSFGWFFLVELTHISWMGATKYHGWYILVVYGLLCFWLAIQWVLFTTFVSPSKELTWSKILAAAAIWTLFEWHRLFVLCGFAFAPLGLSLTWNEIPMQMVALLGVYGLSFWVILSNLAFSRWIVSPIYRKRLYSWSILALAPYVFGGLHLYYHGKEKIREKPSEYYAALVQTGLRAEEKIPLEMDPKAFISPYDQWKLIIESLMQAYEKQHSKLHLIVLPEAAIPYGAKQMIYHGEAVLETLKSFLDKDIEQYLPPLELPYAARDNQGNVYVSNAFWAQTLSNYFKAECVIGLDDAERFRGDNYNAGFVFYPDQRKPLERYEKRVLVPLAEYLPFSFLKPLVAKYGIGEFATHGKEAKIHGQKLPFSISICYEECFGHLMRQGRKKGGKLFVNISNDGWYDPSKLPTEHFILGKIRSIENGVPVVRSCNTGVTCHINSLGQLIARFGDKKHFANEKGAIIQRLDLYCYKTLYTTCGDSLIIFLSCGCLAFFCCKRFKIRSENCSRPICTK